ncbi:hypothetical protein [Streptacidiphilus sp. PAMC 29251]
MGALPDSASTAAPQTSAPTSRKRGAAQQSQVLEYLNANPGIHKVAEIAAAVSGPDASPSAVQGIRRALAALLQAGQADKSTQSGTAFYSAATASAAAPAVKGRATRKKAAPQDAKATATDPDTTVDTSSGKGARIPAARKAKTAPKASPAKKAVPTRTAPKKVEGGAASLPAAGEQDSASVPAPKSVRADRVAIVATLRAAAQPQSAAELSRSVMGEQWKPSDATNFRNVLKSLVKEGAVAVVPGDKNRSSYTAVPTA